MTVPGHECEQVEAFVNHPHAFININLEDL